VASGLISQMRWINLILTVFFASQLFADRVSTRDGSILHGIVLGVSDGNLSLESPYGATLHIPLSEITGLVSNLELTVRDDGNTTIRGQAIPTRSGLLNLRSSTGNRSLPFSRIQHLWDSNGTDPLVALEEARLEARQMKWKHSFGFDLSGSNGNTDSLGIGFRMDNLYSNDFQKLDLYLSHNNRSTNGVSDLEETKAGAEYDSIFSEDMAWYLKGDFENDPIEKIELRATGATGLKHAWIEEENYELFVRGGLAVRHEKFTLSSISSTTDPALDLGLEYSHQFNEIISLESGLSMVPRLDDLSDYLLNHELALLFPIDNGDLWNLRSGLSGSYDSTPGAGLKESDIKYFLSLVYNFK
jgi:putative salt-induced outer membrane protein YdiY